MKPDRPNREKDAQPATGVQNLESGAGLGAAHGSTSPDCCAEWTRSVKAIEGLCVLAHIHGSEYQGAPFKYCPWCGRVRENSDYATGRISKP